MKNLGKIINGFALQTKDSVLHKLINYFTLEDLVNYGKVLVGLAKNYYRNFYLLSPTGYLKDFDGTWYGTTSYDLMVDRLKNGTGESDLAPNEQPCWYYPFNEYVLVEMHVDSNDKLCFLHGTDYYTLDSTGLVVRKMDTLFAN